MFGKWSEEREVRQATGDNIIQSTFVGGILKKKDDISKRHWYGCQLPLVDNYVSQTNHNCLIDSQAVKSPNQSRELQLRLSAVN